MSRYIFDIETDGLLDSLTRVWIIYTLDIDTGELKYWLEGETGWQEVFDNAVLLVGHNVLGFDFMALKKVFGYKLPRTVKVHDTMLMSQILDYRRFGDQGHSMETWGQHLGQPKVEHEDWTQYSEYMRVRCMTDVQLNKKIYDAVLGEFEQLYSRNQNIKPYMQAEHAVAKWNAEAEYNGWPFDIVKARELFARMDKELNEARAILQPLMGSKTVATDKCKGEVPFKLPKWTKRGFYDAHTANWFGISPYSGFEGEERLIEGPYSRVEFEPLDLDSVTDVKIFLFRHNWQPTEWNTKRVLGENGRYQNVQTSPKITEDSLEVLEGHGKLYCDFLTTKSRHSNLKTWIENEKNGRLHGSCFSIGTPSMRSRHSIIVNVPKGDWDVGRNAPVSRWGRELRELFTTNPGWALIGCDSASNQARALAHYLNDEVFADTLINGDIHTYDAALLTQSLKAMGIEREVSRDRAKRILYAFLFGASGAKLWSYIFDTFDQKKGNRLKLEFTEAVPGFKKLLEKLENIYGATKKYGDGYIPGIAGNRIYVDSFHKLLVYLLQSCEKATCSAAVMLTMERLEAAGIPYEPYIMMHDEENFGVPDEYKAQAAEIGRQAFKDGPKLFGIQIMDGSAKIGKNWYEVH